MLRSEIAIGPGFLLLLTGVTLAVFSAVQRYRIRKQLLEAQREALRESMGEPHIDWGRWEANGQDVAESYKTIFAMRCDACGASYGVERQELHQDPRRGYYDVFRLKCTNCGRKRVFESDLPHLEGMAWYEKPGESE